MRPVASSGSSRSPTSSGPRVFKENRVSARTASRRCQYTLPAREVGAFTMTAIPTAQATAPGIAGVARAATGRRRLRVSRRALRLLAVVMAVAFVSAVAWRVSKGHAQPLVRYQTAVVDRGPITAKVTASGALSAIVTVQVGSQVSGRIDHLYVDFNSPVKAGQLIATIEPSFFRAAVAQARANLAAGKAAFDRAVANRTYAHRARRPRRRRSAGALVPSRRRRRARQPLAIAGGPRPGDAQPELHANRLAHRRHRPVAHDRRRADGRRLVPGADPLHDRARPNEDAGRHERRGGRRGAASRRNGGHLHGRRLSGPRLSRRDPSGPRQREHAAKRRHL